MGGSDILSDEDIVCSVSKGAETTLMNGDIFMKTGLIYAHINKINGHMYIGQTTLSLEDRAGKDGVRYLDCPIFGKAIRKYGWDMFDHVVLEDDVPVDELDQRESYWISAYHTCIQDPEYISGYNVSLGGSGKKTATSEETKEKISKANTGKHRTKEQLERLSNAHIGIMQSDETKEKRNNKLRGQKRTDEQRKHYSDSFNKIRAVAIKCLETDVIFNSYKDAAEWLGCDPGRICTHVNDPVGHKSVHKYHFIKVNNS